MNRPIKVVFIIDTLVGFAGTEKHLLDTVTHMNGDIFSCTVISFRTSDKMGEVYRSRNLDLISMPLKKIYGIDAVQKFRQLRNMLRELKPDIVQTFHFQSDTFGVLAARTAGVPCVISSRRDVGDLKKKSHLIMNRCTNRLIDRYIAVCGAVAKKICANEKIPDHLVQVIYNGVDTERFAPDSPPCSEARASLGIPEDAFVVGMVSNFRPEKDLPTFFRAMTILRGKVSNLRIISAGMGNYFTQKKIGDEVAELCRVNKIDDIVMFPGYADDVRPFISAMDVACLTPSHNEGFSNAILEKMSMGKPVVATDVGGNAESVVDGETGFIISPGDHNKLADRIFQLYTDNERRKRMGRNARKRILERFSIERMIQEMERFYVDSVDARSKRKMRVAMF